MTETLVRRAIVLAAGQGKRMKSTLPKVLHDICGRPMIAHVVAALREAGVSDIVAIVSPALRERPEMQALTGVRLMTQDVARGTGDAVRIVLDAIDAMPNGIIAVVNGDMPLLDAPLFEDVFAHIGGATAMAIATARMGPDSTFGRIVRGASGAVERIVEMRDANESERAIEEMNAGVYVYVESALRAVIGELQPNNAQGEYYLTDTLALIRERDSQVAAVAVTPIERVLGVNDRFEMSIAARAMQARICAVHMRNGVTIIDPPTAYIDAGCEIGPDAVIAPNTTLARGAVIGEGARIGPNARIENSQIGNGTHVLESVIVDSTIGDDCRVGPFAHVRMSSVIAGDVRIGNFVEIKNSQLQAGVRAGHLSYLGDAEIGRAVNIGAGTITCNYDGERKHRTVVGEEAFVGSNSSLIAPVTIGRKAVIGAGSVVTRDVESHSTVVGNPARALTKRSAAADAR